MSGQVNGQFGYEGWWEGNGAHKLLRVLNPTRLQYVEQRLQGLGGKRIADVGCGGGIFAEALAAAGAAVTAIDPSEEAIAAAADHAAASGLDIDYRTGTAQDLDAGQFDAVVCMETLEHAADPAATVRECAALLADHGKLFAATINRNPAAYASMILMLERVLGLLPDGSHSYACFIKPAELAGMCEKSGLAVSDIVGVNWSHFGKTFFLSHVWMPANYMIEAKIAGK